MVIFKDNVKALCVQICKELGEEPETEAVNWAKYESMVRDWLVMEAFRRVRDKYWDDQNRSVKPSVSVTEESKMT